MNRPPTTRNTVPRLILIFGVQTARDMIKALTLADLDAAFSRAVDRAISKNTKKLWRNT